MALDEAGSPMRWAIFSDVHSNLEALEAVIQDIGTQSIDRIACLGDTVGYAAEPASCWRRVKSLADISLRGNHDEWAASDIEFLGAHRTAEAGFELARVQLNSKERQELAGLPLTWQDGDVTLVHSSLRSPEQWYYVDCVEEAAMHFVKQRSWLAFCGHTHVPVVIWQSSPTNAIEAADGEGAMELPNSGKVLVNVGSVGQPRDHDPRACYVVFDVEERSIEFRRVEYDVRSSQRRIMEAGLPRFTAERLRVGR